MRVGGRGKQCLCCCTTSSGLSNFATFPKNVAFFKKMLPLTKNDNVFCKLGLAKERKKLQSKILPQD